MKSEIDIVILEDHQLTADFLSGIVVGMGLPLPQHFSDQESAEAYLEKQSIYPKLAFCDINIGGEILGLKFAAEW